MLYGEEPSFFVRLSSDNPSIAARLPKDGLAIHSFPFSVGRPPGEDEEAPARLVDLLLEDERPFWIARVQFTLIREHGVIRLIDSSSVHGTVVNENWIGPGRDSESTELRPGHNRVELGGEDSPYGLDLEVEVYAGHHVAA